MTIVVIQCAKTKFPDDTPESGYMKTSDGRRVMFVADPRQISGDARTVYVHPDDLVSNEDDITWRDKLLQHNKTAENLNATLRSAWKLYKNPTYELLGETLGPTNLYLLSAGWGLIPANFLTPNYDITFSSLGEPHNKRLKKPKYRDFKDFRMLEDTGEPIMFFICKGYYHQALELTDHINNSPKHLFYNAAKQPRMPSFELHKYKTKIKTNWHYACAKDFINGEIEI